MSDAIRNHAWSETPLGPIEGWPPALKTIVALALSSQFPQAVVWGDALVTLYNDAFLPILGDKPAPLGKPFSEIWSEAWSEIGPISADAFAGKATFIENFPLTIDRSGTPEQAFFTFCYSPVRDEDGRIVGMIDTVVETTATVLNGRRLAFLDDLSRTLASATDAVEIMAATTRMTAEHLGGSNCAYADMDEDEDGFTIRGDWAAPGSPNITGHYRLADFGTLAVTELGAGRPLIVHDNLAELAPQEAATFQAIGIAATICVPLIKDERLVALMAIHSRVPRRWTSYDVSLILDVTERSWAHIERVRADAEVHATAKALADLTASLEKIVQERTARLMETETALRQAQKMDAMGQLTGGVAHDFNNLLTPIIGSLDMLMRRGVGSEREQRLIDGALQSAERARALVQRLLAFARRQPLKPSAVDLARLVEGMVGLIGSTLGPTIDVRVDLAADLPPAKADPNQLEMALLNLAVNARDAMPEGGVLTIKARLEEAGADHKAGIAPGHYVRLCVGDTGIGMDEETLERAIEPFFSTKGIGKGTGLGLSMVHGLVAQLGGGMAIESEPGEGSTIELWLPVSNVAADRDEASPDSRPMPQGLGTALLVDDEELVRMSTADMLTDLGYDVVEAGSADEALRLVREGLRPDLLVSDHLMPGMSGAELARRLKAERPELRVLIVSGYADQEGIDADVARLTKPFRNAELAASLAALSPAASAGAG